MPFTATSLMASTRFGNGYESAVIELYKVNNPSKKFVSCYLPTSETEKMSKKKAA